MKKVAKKKFFRPGSREEQDFFEKELKHIPNNYLLVLGSWHGSFNTWGLDYV